MIIKTGSPMLEVINTYRNGIENSDVTTRLGIREYEYFVLSVHREENVDIKKNFLNLMD